MEVEGHEWIGVVVVLFCGFAPGARWTPAERGDGGSRCYGVVGSSYVDAAINVKPSLKSPLAPWTEIPFAPVNLLRFLMLFVHLF